MTLRRFLRSLALLLALGLCLSRSASALPELPILEPDPPPGPALYEVFNLLTGGALGGNDELAAFQTSDELWLSDGNLVAVLVGADLNLANVNTFGYYDDEGVGADQTNVFEDVANVGILPEPYQAEMIGGQGEVGFFLDTTGENFDNWLSESDLDAGETTFDHLVTLALGDLTLETTLGTLNLTNASLLGWEDLADDGPPDGDYNDQMIVVGYVVPEPGTLVLFGLGATGLVLASRRRR